jgi:hypothetical protein
MYGKEQSEALVYCTASLNTKCYQCNLGVLILKALLFRLDVREIVPDTLNDAALTGDDAAMLCYRLGETSNEPAQFIRTVTVIRQSESPYDAV